MLTDRPACPHCGTIQRGVIEWRDEGETFVWSCPACTKPFRVQGELVMHYRTEPANGERGEWAIDGNCGRTPEEAVDAYLWQRRDADVSAGLTVALYDEHDPEHEHPLERRHVSAADCQRIMEASDA